MFAMALCAVVVGAFTHVDRRQERSTALCAQRLPKRHGPEGQGKPPPEWRCRACGVSNWASRTSCYRCGAKTHVVRRKPRREAFWKAATAHYGPADVAADLEASLWWLQPKPDVAALDHDDLRALADSIGITADQDQEALRRAIDLRYETYSRDDSNFRKPSFNPRVKDLAPCYPEVYEDDTRLRDAGD
mmetsp:Transcript_1341/g.4575  ORF Transcript_1341/g.4575 Transcript_1341/m.4575 type:complete len:189 (-) Transcript_1341:245-811(-)